VPATRPVSGWFAAAGDAMPAPRPPLDGDATVDVCIVGGGYTGLWTAYELRRADPSLDVLVVEREVCGFGASGRNGGWVQGHLAGDPRTWRRRGGPAGAAALERAIGATVGAVGAVVTREGIACDWHAGGTLMVAQTEAEERRLRTLVAGANAHRDLPEGEGWLDAEGLAARVRVRGGRRAWWSPLCARVQPAALARGLAAAVERAGARIVEGTTALELRPAPRGRATAGGRDGDPASVVTDHGTVRSRWVVRATEGYTAGLPGSRRALAPIGSTMILTEPLGVDRWAAIGWDGAETILDGGLLYHYLQRTADGRIAIGGRGVPYRWGSSSAREDAPPAATIAGIEAGLGRLFGDAVAGVGTAAAWHGVLGVPRDWSPGVSADPATGIAWAGGYVGEGVAASNLAGRTLADLLRGERTALTALPWVVPPGRRPRRWEPEPLRWLGIRGVHAFLGAAQEVERRRGRPTRLSDLALALSGH
jgi:glycine/D-amino acid oxidase-like deaminating enzyme